MYMVITSNQPIRIVSEETLYDQMNQMPVRPTAETKFAIMRMFPGEYILWGPLTIVRVRPHP
jgi:hypothetical protein